tara:strand:+ start:338 stop:511 length:174 start_codon:yes stop_codon:yes gene_type:complete
LDLTTFKNKRHAIKALMREWEDYFGANIEFKKEYELKYFGIVFPDNTPPRSIWPRYN